MSRIFPVLAMLGAVAAAACRNERPANVAVLFPDGGTRWIDPNKVLAGPVRHEVLTDTQTARITALQRTFRDVDDSPIEKWIDDFKHDANVDRELSVYEAIAKAYVSYTGANPVSLEARREVYSLLLIRSGTTSEEALARTKLRALDERQAREVLRQYGEPPHPIRVTDK